MEHGNGADSPQPHARPASPLARSIRLERKATLHPHASWKWGTVAEVAPEFSHIEFPPDLVVHALRIDDPDGESHVVLFSDEAKRKLISTAAGGVVLPG